MSKGMSKHLSLLLVGSLTLMLAACSERKGCSIKGHTSFEQYQKAYLTDLDQRPVDSVEIAEGKFAFDRKESAAEPYAMLVRLQQTAEPHDWIEMPVFIENGNVRMEIGEYIHTAGTPLNEALQSFFDQLQQSKDAIAAKEGVSVEEIENTFSEFYRQQIMLNQGNALGRYIYRAYGIHLKGEDKAQVEEIMK